MVLSFDLHRAVREVLSHDTGGSGTPRELLSYLMDLLYYAEFHIVEQAAAVQGGDQTNLVGWRGPRAGGTEGLLLCSAIQNYGPVDWLDWTETEEDPFNPTIRDGLLYGVGTLGGKVDLICKILATANIEHAALKKPVYIAGLFGPQARVGGAMYLLDSMICSPEWVVVSEPTNLELVRSHRGYMIFEFDVELPAPAPVAERKGRVFRVEAQGEPGNTACRGAGRNAVDLALRTIEQLRHRGHGFTVHHLQGGGFEGCVPPKCSFYLYTEEPDWYPAGAQLIVEGVSEPVELGPPLDEAIEAWTHVELRLHELFRWTSPNTAPDFLPSGPIYAVTHAFVRQGQLHITMDYRTLPGQRTQQLITDVDALVRRSSNSGRRIRADVSRHLMPMDDDPEDTLGRVASECLREIGIPPINSTWSGSTEGWIFSSAGIPTLVFGPGSGLAMMYRPNEHTVMNHMVQATRFYERLIRRLCM